ncbi:class I SAM-dependent methyltransferase [Streptomonospora sp. PA3]|uniref:class I SAM-dependent methyltransferase n=1 Tax=Streptomonospora sp. PA3 TaxID=2607326 RepID=UPI0012DE5C8F|nr:class I SAM-dependent methyltransferase [Streptomonospora sp. PA3]MUL41945.1 class I SAM-dependent methyltransferase [Streptomonospora sp. PA3]
MRPSDEVVAHYSRGVERDRLGTWGRLEALRTRELLARFLPSAPAVVWDVGGAEGAYALPLAEAGYEVYLLDPVPAHVDAARAASARQAAAPLAGAVVGDARGLPAASATADAVLLLGPLYHLTEARDRESALTEAYRVLRPGGRLLAAAISRFASTLDGLRAGMAADPVFEGVIEGDLDTGVHRNPEGRPGWFTLAYFHRPDELREEVRRSGFSDAEVYAVEGPCAQASMNLDLDDPVARHAALRAIARVEQEPSLLGASSHLMAVASKP